MLVLQVGCTSLSQVAPHSPVGLPMTITTPPLTPECIRFLEDEAAPEEYELLQSLGDAWNIPRWGRDCASGPLGSACIS